MKYLCHVCSRLILLMGLFVFAFRTENELQEVWIWTSNDGNNDHYNSIETYKHYTSITKYPVISFDTKSFNVSSRCYGGNCNARFVLLSVAADLMSTDYYEIFIGITGQFRKSGVFDNNWDFYGELPIHCDEFRDFTISWANDGTLSIYNGFSGETAQWKDTLLPIHDIRGVGIKTGFRDEGLWKFKHSGTFDGYFCTRHQTYGSMDILETTTAREIQCAVLCGRSDDCLGMNFNSNTKACELLKSRQAVILTNSTDWMLSTKCLDGHSLCQACM